MIYTSYFAKSRTIPEDILSISIAIKSPEKYCGLMYSKLMPSWSTLKQWKLNHDEMQYMDLYGAEVLEPLNPYRVVSELYKLSGGKDIALTCYEKTGYFCHRKLVAEWLNKSGYQVQEWQSDIEKEGLVVTVTGHRPHKLFGYDMSDARYLKIKEKMKNHLVETNCTVAVTGMALGIDQIFAEAVIEIKNLGYPIELLCAVPCKNHPCKWPKKSQEHYQWILSQADRIVQISNEDYKPWQMQLRNEYMVHVADEVLAIWDGTKGGTGNCVEYAQSLHKKMEIINPTV